ncbi:MAG TPA: hypothetical protein VHV55_08730 [Pirellulales bacterium]|jgi:hypothetical protein|nr:hypothetical protein [Pirellulales bacterium]
MLREVAFISDTCTLPGYIAAAPGRYPALRFQYRPATMPERAAIVARQHAQPADELAANAAAMLVQKLVSWELADGSAIPPLAAESVLALHAELFRKLYLIVLGYEASAVDPAWPAEIADEVLHDRAEAAAEGRTPGEVGDERREKN